MADDSSLLQECAESDAERIAMKRMPVFLFICALLLLSASPCFAQMYTVTDLGTFSPTVINSSGQVVGNLNGHGYLWTRTKGLQDLGLLTGGTFSTAVAINDLGMVAGTADGEGTERYFNGFPNVECSGLTQPFIWTQDGGMKGLGTYSVFYDVPCLVGLYTTGINALGTVVGYTRIYDTSQTGFVWTATGDFTFIRWSTDPPVPLMPSTIRANSLANMDLVQ